MSQEVSFDRSYLSEVRDAHRGPRPGPLLRAMLFDYAIIGATLTGMVSLWGNPWFWAALPVAWVIIAARQHALLVLMHEPTHSLAHPVRWINEAWGEVLLGAPMFVSMRKYRTDHLTHHRLANSEQDPDWVRKLGTEEEARYWRFPVAGSGFGFLLKSWLRSIRYLISSFTHLSNVKGNGSGAESQPKPDADPLSRRIGQARLGFYLVVAVALTALGGWGFFVLLWLAPILLVLPMIMRLRSIAEHFALPYDSELTSTRTIVCGPIERFLFGPHNINYHLEHHLLASVAFSELPALHAKLMQRPGYAQEAALCDSYLLGPQSLRADMLRPRSGRSAAHSTVAKPPAVGPSPETAPA